jgi:hypothetical protein
MLMVHATSSNKQDGKSLEEVEVQLLRDDRPDRLLTFRTELPSPGRRGRVGWGLAQL